MEGGWVIIAKKEGKKSRRSILNYYSRRHGRKRISRAPPRQTGERVARVQRRNGLFHRDIHVKIEWPNQQRPTDRANPASPSDESTNHLQKHFYAIIPAARRDERSRLH